MVAISLYRGNLHRVPDVPRRWLMPTRKISLKDFKSLLHRRSQALTRLRSSTNGIATTSNHNPNADKQENASPAALKLEAAEGTNREEEGTNREEEGTSKGSASKEVKDQKTLDCGDCSAKTKGLSELSLPEKAEDEAVNADGNFQPEKMDLCANPDTEVYFNGQFLSFLLFFSKKNFTSYILLHRVSFFLVQFDFSSIDLTKLVD